MAAVLRVIIVNKKYQLRLNLRFKFGAAKIYM